MIRLSSSSSLYLPSHERHEGSMDSYEWVTILRNGGNNKERYATIRWKHLDCP